MTGRSNASIANNELNVQVEIMLLFTRLLSLLLALNLMVVLTTPAKAQNYEELFRGFQSSALNYDERRFLQTALAFKGHYVGLLDGDWGRMSREAMSRYSSQKFGTRSEEWHIALLALEFFEQFDAQGWKMEFFPSLGVSILLPSKQIIIDPPTENLVNLRHSGSSLAISLGAVSAKAANSFHTYTLKLNVGGGTPYSVRKKNFAVSTGTNAQGTKVYTRSNFVDGSWSTVMVSAAPEDWAVLSAVASSVSLGNTRDVFLPTEGRLFGLIKSAIEFVKEEEAEEEAVAVSAAPKQRQEPAASGSGFVVSEAGHVLTNAHVIKGCQNIFVDGIPAKLVASSSRFDLAVLQAAALQNKNVAVFSASPARLNSDVTVVGYPYAGLLGGLNVTRGSVSSLKGIKGDITKMQITAPVQSGNSGGPLLAADGQIVGVVVSKLDAQIVADEIGDVPQNVNFAIRGEIAKLFLSQNLVEPRLSLDNTRLLPEILAQEAAAFTTFIECH